MKSVMQKMKATGWLLVILLLFSSSAMAIQEPQVLVQETTDKITSVLRTNQDKVKADSNYLLTVVDDIVASHFDFDRMSSWVLGKYWRKAKPDEKKRFASEFRTLLVRTYAKALNDNYDKKIAMLPVRVRDGGDEALVRTEVQQDAGFPIPIDYRMYVKDGTWLVYDVSVDGISLVTNYRSSFSTEIRKDGLPKLIDRLTERNKSGVVGDDAKK